MTISSFTGDYRWLSNFSSHSFYGPSNVWFKTNEHFYQSMKTVDVEEKERIINCDTPNCAKKLGQLCTIRSDWNNIKLDIMRIGLRNKFNQNPIIKQYLIDTGDEELIEGNYWGDRYWGVCNGEGQNWLGKLLMELRTNFKHMEIFE